MCLAVYGEFKPPDHFRKFDLRLRSLTPDLNFEPGPFILPASIEDLGDLEYEECKPPRRTRTEIIAACNARYIEESILLRWAEQYKLKKSVLEEFSKAYETEVKLHYKKLYNGNDSGVIIIGTRDRQLSAQNPSPLHAIHLNVAQEIRSDINDDVQSRLEKLIKVKYYCGLHLDSQDPFYGPIGLLKNFILQARYHSNHLNPIEEADELLESFRDDTFTTLCRKMKDTIRILALGRKGLSFLCYIDKLDLFQFHEDPLIREQAQQVLLSFQDIVSEIQKETKDARKTKKTDKPSRDSSWADPGQVQVIISETSGKRFTESEFVHHIDFRRCDKKFILEQMEGIAESISGPTTLR